MAKAAARKSTVAERDAALSDRAFSATDVTLAVQHRVRDYLTRMADIEAPTVNVVVDEVGEPEEA